MTMESSGAPEPVVSTHANDDSRRLREQLTELVAPRYQVGDEIGRGGMALVYRGWDTKEHRSIAFKVLRREYAVIGSSRFFREIRLLTQLHHPGILPLLDSGHSETLSYFIMPLAEGETLQARLDREPQLPLAVVQQIVSQVAAALDYAHRTGVVHRDIKPSNLFLTGDRVVLADFGIAKEYAPPEDETTTSTGIVVGTVLYMSPEQGDGNLAPDHRTDVYSLGCVAYEMLAGEPPFTGPTQQAVMARHRSMPPPSVRVVRPDLPAGIDYVIRKALAKSPADRYQTAGDFAQALSDPAKLAAAARELERMRPGVRRWATGAAVAGAALFGMFLLRPKQSLDPNKIVVFPMGETPPGATSEGMGIQVALMIGNALEYTDPLEWIDGLPLLDARLRSDPGMLTVADAHRITRQARARWYVDGTVIRRRDSVTVVARLNDAAGDSVAGRRSATRVTSEAAQAGLDAINTLLPKLLSPGQRLGNLSALSSRHPAAVASWLQGEREYRRFNFSRALEFQRRAVAADSLLAVAALRGAQAASWLNDMPQADSLAQVALRHVSLLPPRMKEFAHGLKAYLGGQADSAFHWLTLAVQRDPDWTEAHMALGEVYYHLLPSVQGPPDSLAQAEFIQAAADTGFSPPLFHLAEIAIRRGSPLEAERAVQAFLTRVEDEGSRAQLAPMLLCVRAGRTAVDWHQAVASAPLEALRAAKMLAAAGAFPGCAEDGLRAVFSSSQISLGYRWGAFLGLQGLLAAEGRITELRRLVDSAMGTGIDRAPQLYLLDALADVNLDSQATLTATRLSSEASEKTRPFTLWLVGGWQASKGNRVGAERMKSVLAARAAATHDPMAARLADALSARLFLLRGDTAGTIKRLRPALGVGRREILDWDLAESLAPERLLLAELLLATGQPAAAWATAGMFDHQAPAAFLPFLPASLDLRRRAALALGQKGDASVFQGRLAALGQGGSLARGSSPNSTPEAP